MVEVTDERRMQCMYASYRTDKPAMPGYTADLMHKDTPVDCYDDFNKLPELQNPTKDIINVFLKQVAERPNKRLFGTRAKNEDGTFGAYEWMTYADVNVIYEEIAKGCKSLGLFEVVQGINEDGKDWRFAGIWAKNRWEWHTTLLSCMACKVTTIGFYDSMGDSSVDYCLKQTQLETMFITSEYLKKLLAMRDLGMAISIKNVVMFDSSSDQGVSDARERAEQQYGIRVFTLDEIREEGRKTDVKLEPELVEPDDIYMLNYTSGTTGDSKGVKVSHWGVLCSAYVFMETSSFNEHDVIIDYLPAPHVFDQYMFTTVLIAGACQGYYQGNPLKLTEDMAVLQPTIFPSVPRLYNKIYAKIKNSLESATGCKKWLIDKAMASKSHYLTEEAQAAYRHSCYDSLVFNKVAKILGGRVKLAITASAPISKEVLEFLKVVMCCPILEAFGMSETSGATNLTFEEDPISGTIGGPMKHVAIRLKDLPDMDYRIDDKPYPRGEICLRSPCVTSGYFMNPGKTAEAIDEEGYMHTGDVGVVYPNGAVRILDRCKNIFKLSQGEYVAPEKLENIYIQSNYILQALIYGDSLKHCTVGIIVTDPEKVNEWATANGKDAKQVLAEQDPAFKKLVMDDIMALSKDRKLNRLEIPKDIYLAQEAFSVENEIVTPTFKLKRNVGQKVYQAQIDAMYAELVAKDNR